MEDAGIFFHSPKTLSISCSLDVGGPRASAFILFFHVQKNIFNDVKFGDLRWPCKVSHLTATQVNFGKY